MFKVSLEEFEAFVREGVDAIPEKFRSRISNVAFLADDEPTPAQRKENKLRSDETLFGLYEGIPRPARGEEYCGMVLPDRITVFRKPIEEEAHHSAKASFGRSPDASKDAFRDEVRKHVIDTVWHEVAHHFGLDEQEVERREVERGRQ